MRKVKSSTTAVNQQLEAMMVMGDGRNSKDKRH